jgi:hypothetical protein
MAVTPVINLQAEVLLDALPMHLQVDAGVGIYIDEIAEINEHTHGKDTLVRLQTIVLTGLIAFTKPFIM